MTGMTPTLTDSFVIEDWDGGRVRVNAAFAEMLRKDGLTTFTAFWELNRGQVARQVAERSTSRVEFSDGESRQVLYVKRHHRPTLWQRFKPLLRFTQPIHGARNEWNAILQFHAAGIPTMTPVAFGECDDQSFLVTQSLEGFTNLLDLVRRDNGTNATNSPAFLQRLTAEVARIARTMHREGLHHQDFYLNHLLIPENTASPLVRVIDLGRARKLPRLSRRWIIKDLAQLDFSARSLACRERLRFLRAYLGRPLNRDDKPLIRRIWFKSRHIARHTARNGL